MALIYIVRHGKAAAGFTDNADPGLDELGRSQAEAAANALTQFLPLNIVSSPLLRAQETAQPFAAQTGQSVTIESRIAEIPSPGLSLTDRGPWLQAVMAGHWSEQSADLQSWRRSLQQCLLEVSEDTVMFSHFVAINTALGLATNSDQVMLTRPDNGSITVLNNGQGVLSLVTKGVEASTKVN
tara:strand:- start:33548 stop:34096 length:549 start_codon:yes stop_codon:yes gene_type:complete